MKLTDNELGMDRSISRRDFLNVAASAAAVTAMPGGGIDPAEDIAGLTVNRWGHGYGYWHNRVTDPDYEHDEYPHIIGGQRFGRISIANADAGARASIRAAIDQAYRAVEEVI